MQSALQSIYVLKGTNPKKVSVIITPTESVINIESKSFRAELFDTASISLLWVESNNYKYALVGFFYPFPFENFPLNGFLFLWDESYPQAGTLLDLRVRV